LPSPQLWIVPPTVQVAEAMLPDSALSPQERDWGLALSPRLRVRYWRSRAALRRLLQTVLGRPAALVPLQSPPGQPPLLGEGLGSVSLSHAAGAVLVAWAPRPVGVDLELSSRCFDARSLARRFFSPAELEHLRDLAPEPHRAAVLRSWLAKEAVIKWRQRSLAHELADWCFEHSTGVLSHRRDGTVRRPCEGVVDGWAWAAVGEDLEGLKSAPLPLIWRFQDDRSCFEP